MPNDLLLSSTQYLIDLIAGKYGVVLQVLSLVFSAAGILRAILAPLITLLQTITNSTPTLKDNAVLDKILTSKAYLAVVKACDFLLGLKLPVKPQV